MPTGTVKWFDMKKGYGFIKPDDGGKDAFVHVTAMKDAGIPVLDEEQKINFDMVEDKRGRMSAGNLELL